MSDDTRTIDTMLGELQHELDLVLLRVERGVLAPIDALTTFVRAERTAKGVIARVSRTGWSKPAKARIASRLREMFADARTEAEHFVVKAGPGGGVGQA